METKVCRLCKQELDKKLFYKAKRSADGLRSECKKCAKAISNAGYMNNTEKIKNTRKARYHANPEKEKAAKKARYDADPENAKTMYKVWYEANRDEILAKTKARYDADPDKKKAMNNAWRNAHSEKAKASSKARYDANPKKANARIKVWAKAHPEAVSMHYQTRRSKKAGLPSTLTPEQWGECKDHFDGHCAYCGTGNKALHQEHFIPVTSGGEYSKDNVICACGSCNSSKGAKDFFDWYKTFKYYSKAREEKILEFLHYTGATQQLTLCT